MSRKQAAEKHGVYRHEPGTIQILPDFSSLQSPEGRDFYFSWGRGEGIRARPELSSKPFGTGAYCLLDLPQNAWSSQVPSGVQENQRELKIS